MARFSPTSLGPAMCSVDTRDLERLEGDFVKFRSWVYPRAVQQTLNDVAFEARRQYADLAAQRMKLRSPWTVASMRVEKVTFSELVGNMASTAGSVEDFMETQEEGARESKKGAIGVPIPAAAPGKRLNRGRTPKSKQLTNIRTVKGAVKGSRQVRNASAIRKAAAMGGGFVFLDLRKRKGLFRVFPGKRRLMVRKAWDLSKGAVVIKRNPMLMDAKDKAMQRLDGLYREALVGQLRRNKVFGY